MPSRLRRAVPLALTVTLAAAAGAGAPALADGEAPYEVVASGLNSPKHLSFAPNGDLYVAESGAPTADSGQCLDHPEFGTTCLNTSSSITKISRQGGQTRVVTGLPALVSEADAVGAFDVVVHGSTLTVAMGLGGTPETRAAFGPGAAAMGTVVDVKKGRVTVRADLAAYEDAHDPDGAGSDSNPVDLAAGPGGRLVAVDAGGNDVLTVSKQGRIGLLAVFPSPGMAEAPPFLGLPSGAKIPYQSVPTAAAQGPDGAWYVSELTGFPFPAGRANIYRVGADGAPEVYATGLTNVTDLAWDGGDLYAVQLTDGGLLAGPPGSLVKVSTDGAHSTVVGGLAMPYGVALRDGSAYVTTGSVFPGGGEVIRVDLP